MVGGLAQQTGDRYATSIPRRPPEEVGPGRDAAATARVPAETEGGVGRSTPRSREEALAPVRTV
jgi:hypothetical protein